jgi:hypothetical protein
MQTLLKELFNSMNFNYIMQATLNKKQAPSAMPKLRLRYRKIILFPTPALFEMYFVVNDIEIR